MDERKWQKNEVEDRGMSADCASDAEQVGSDTESEAHLPAVKLGSPLKVVSINQLEKQGEHFLGFGSQLRQFLSDSKEDHNEAQIGNNVPMEEVMVCTNSSHLSMASDAVLFRSVNIELSTTIMYPRMTTLSSKT